MEDLLSSSFSLELPGLGNGAGGDGNSTSMGDHQNSLHPAAMGGIVGGSILAAAVAGAVIFLLIRRRTRKRQSRKQSATEPDCPELAAGQRLLELHGRDPLYDITELHGDQSKVEMDSQDPHQCAIELEATERRCTTEKRLRGGPEQDTEISLENRRLSITPNGWPLR